MYFDTGSCRPSLPSSTSIIAATLTIVDDDVPGSVQFGAATYDVTEGTATVTITVNQSAEMQFMLQGQMGR
jgi:hypothetical protein